MYLFIYDGYTQLGIQAALFGSLSRYLTWPRSEPPSDDAPE